MIIEDSRSLATNIGPDEELIYRRPASLTTAHTHYCPGCTHGVAHRLIAEVIDELGIREKTIGVAPVGCAVFAYNYFNCDFAEAAHGRAPAMATGIKRVQPDKVVFAYNYFNCDFAEAAHGRAPAMATGIKRVQPDKVVFTYQGDGDLAAIGTAEIIHAAARGENITVIFINNAIYGMTGGQMAPTTLPNMKTTSTPTGRDVELAGFPIRMAELLARLDGAAYVVRRSLHNPAEIRKAKKAIRSAFENQMQGRGFSLVELLSSCPVNWNMQPVEALKWIETHMMPIFPLGDYKSL